MSKEKFEAALATIRGAIKETVYETWFSRLRFLGEDDEVVQVGTPNAFIKEWLEGSDHVLKLAQAMSETFGRPITPELVIIERDAEARKDAGLPPGLSEEDAQELAPAAPAPEPAPSARPVDADWSAPLKTDYVFENFIVGPSNRLSHAAALAVAQSPGQAYNPLFLHSASGLGKTHLLQAICVTLLQGDEAPTILYLSCEDFVNQFIEAVKDGDLESFRYRYRNVDLLLVDDIHFLADKPRIQEEFFHTFNTLYNAHKQIVLSADCHPSEIPTLSERLVSRFNWGLVSRIDPPEFETRAAIIKKKAQIRGIELSTPVTNLLAARITSNVREVEGALNRLVGTARLMNKEVDEAFAIEVLADLLQDTNSRVTIEAIVDAVCARFEVKLGELKSKKRPRRIALPRQICMYLARTLTDMTLQDVGDYFGKRDHTTVMYAAEKIETALEADAELKTTIDELGRQARGLAVQSARQ